MIATIKSILESIFFTTFPRKCLLCDEILQTNEKKICYKCQQLYSYPCDINIGEFYAPLYPYIKGICVLGFYSYVKVAIKKFKFGGNVYIGKQLSYILCEKLAKTDWIKNIDIVIPVPLHRTKKRQRGFNQSEIISQIIAKKFNKQLVINNLIRTINNKDQHGSSQDERYKNVCGIFKIKDIKAFEQKKVLIVDDVITTCSTALECCKEIKKCAGAEIYICSLASDREII